MLYKPRFLLQRWRYADKAARTPLDFLYQQQPVDSALMIDRCRFLVVDCEMSGLDVRSNELLSIGWVQVDAQRVVNSSGGHVLIHTEQHTGDSSTIHGLTNSMLAGASSAASAILMLARLMPGSVLVFHHAPIDLAFLQQAAHQHYRAPMLFSYIDTMEIERRRHRSRENMPGLRLGQCRERYGLPDTAQHNALADARATAELLLAQLSHVSAGKPMKLTDLPLRCAI